MSTQTQPGQYYTLTHTHYTLPTAPLPLRASSPGRGYTQGPERNLMEQNSQMPDAAEAGAKAFMLPSLWPQRLQMQSERSDSILSILLSLYSSVLACSVKCLGSGWCGWGRCDTRKGCSCGALATQRDQVPGVELGKVGVTTAWGCSFQNPPFSLPHTQTPPTSWCPRRWWQEVKWRSAVWCRTTARSCAQS